MDEPNFKKQIDDAYDQYEDGLITEDEYNDQLGRICHNYDEWMERNEKKRSHTSYKERS